MASSTASAVAFLFLLTAISLLMAQSHAQSTCATQKFTNNKLYDRCSDLPQLGCYLHWFLDSTKITMYIVFIVPPATPDGWISWAINPTDDGMVDPQISWATPDGWISL
ncbi:hypothetical protein L2E82_04059 [Cichorium intybus]|uniref:Uncharacterized protein n=1 Tax=Cichorium intybus TaxID=13427 RepID=A0ACB9H4U6_CICIN|nr:hypothetical protein L2E82_04059 [Cichorium intybus]